MRQKSQSLIHKGRNLILSTIAGIAMTISSLGQEDASGTIKFVPEADAIHQTDTIHRLVPNATATKLSGADMGNVINLNNYFTNEEQNFSGWTSDNLGIEEFIAGLANYYTLGNPRADLNFILKTDNPNNVLTEIYDLIGKKVATIPKAENLFNGNAQVYFDTSRFADAIYLVNIKDGNKQSAFQFIKNGSDARGALGESHNSQQRLEKNEKKNEEQARMSMQSRTSSPTGENNYNFSWGEINLPGNAKILAGNVDKEIVQGSNNEIIIDMDTYFNDTGDVAYEFILNGSPKDNVNITLTEVGGAGNVYQRNNTGTQEIFLNVSVPNFMAASEYQVNVTANDGTFLTTNITDYILQDEADEGGNVENGSKQINLNNVPNAQNITVKTVNTTSREGENNIKVFMKDFVTDTTLNTIVSDENAEAKFMGVPGGSEVYFAVDTTSTSIDIYETSRGKYTVPTITNTAQQDTLLNYSVRPKPVYESGQTISADSIMSFKPNKYNIEALRGSDEIYFDPNEPLTPIQIQHLQNGEDKFPITFFVYNTTSPYELPSAEDIAAYQPFLNNQNFLDGIIGSNATPTGTDTTMEGKTLDNGKEGDFYSSQFKLGGDQEGRNHHEAFCRRHNLNTTGGVTFRNSDATMSVPITQDEATALYYSLEDAVNVYILFDNQDRPYNYSEYETIND